MKKILYVVFTYLLLTCFTLLFFNRYYLFHTEKNIEPVYRDTLVYAAMKSLQSLDVPVSALLIYNGKIIGTGYNSVKQNKNIGEHAEINAISSAIKLLGFEEFKKLNRDSLILIITFEPCPMCTGAILEYHIKNIFVVKEKPLNYILQEEWNWLKYLLMRKKIDANNLQDSLFRLHPDYFFQPE